MHWKTLVGYRIAAIAAAAMIRAIEDCLCKEKQRRRIVGINVPRDRTVKVTSTGEPIFSLSRSASRVSRRSRLGLGGERREYRSDATVNDHA